MHFLLRSLTTSLRHTHHHHLNHRTLYDSASSSSSSSSIKWVRDRGLDHAVLREKNLKPVINLKNLIKSEPSKSLPLSIITSSKESLQIPARPIEFIRKYPSIFDQFFPGNLTIHPHIKLSSEALNLDVEENLVYESVSYKQNVADRLLKLLMIGRVNKIPLGILDRIKWELGLPQDFVRSIVPEFPDYFTVSKGIVGGSDEMLELVCWSDELAVSVIEKKAKKVGVGKGVSIEFPLKYTKGFEMDKKCKKWVDEWQKLPYVSPYENALHLAPKGDDSDKWAVAVLHEILNLFVGKKAEKESVLCLGEFLGLRSRFKRALLQHPGIFYVSSKNWTHTVVLRDGYKRGMLIEKDMLMDMRFKYVRLMNTVKEEDKARSVQQKAGHQPKEGEKEDLENDLSDEEEDEEMYDLSNEDTDDDYEDDDDDEEDNDDENAKNRGRLSNKTFEEKKSSRNLLRSSAGANPRKTVDRTRPRFSMRTDGDDESAKNRGRTSNKTTFQEKKSSRNLLRSSAGASPRKTVAATRPRFSRRTDGDDESAKNRGRLSNKTTFEEKKSSRNLLRSSGEANPRNTEDRTSPRFSRRTDRDGQNFRGRSRERSDVQRYRGRSDVDRSTST